MGVPLKVAVACSEVAIALGDTAAATYLSAGFRLFGVDAGGGPCWGLFWGCGLRRLARIVRLVVLGGFASRRGNAVTCGRLYGGVLLTVVAAGVFLSVVGVAEVGMRVFSSALVVAVVSAALWCRDWRLALPAAALLALFLAAVFGVGG
jgi:hypothetical protein